MQNFLSAAGAVSCDRSLGRRDDADEIAGDVAPGMFEFLQAVCSDRRFLKRLRHGWSMADWLLNHV
jgi:hypothetical protein